MNPLGDFVGRTKTSDGAAYRWRTLSGATATAHVRLSPNSQTLVTALGEGEVERVVHGIARFLAQNGEADTCIALHHNDRSGGDSHFGQFLEKLMSEHVLSRTRLWEIVAAHPELRPIAESFAAIWFDRDGEFL